MTDAATILVGSEAPSCTNSLKGVLRFFGVESRVSTLDEFLVGALVKEPCLMQTKLLCSSSTLLDILKRLGQAPTASSFWRRNVHSVFVYADQDAAALVDLQQHIVSNDHIPLVRFDRGRNQWFITDKCPDFCGPMSGLGVQANQGLAQVAASVQVTDERNTVFVKGFFERVPIFLSASDRVVDVDAPLAGRNFDIREEFLSAAPIVMYVKWAFAGRCWHVDHTDACFVIDDPLLTPHYGFLNYQSLLALMERHNFTTNVAFIPWNWKRCDASVVDLFRNRSDRYSISIHGCDHTGDEFGTQDKVQLAWKSRQAIDRMMRMEAAWGIPHDRVMVFPQGVFSGASMAALKNARYLAAVNTEVLNHEAPQLPISVSDVWDVAVMRYQCFPLFTRRYPSQGVENLAFDILLGKPCLVVSHHDICRNDQAHLVEFIQELNALNCRLSWRSLGEVVRRSCRQRELSDGIIEIEMYGNELHLENNSSHQRDFRIARREADGTAIREVRADSHLISWEFSDGRVRFRKELGAGQNALICIILHERGADTMYQESLSYKLKVMLRRYLSEIRDNYAAVWMA